MSSIINSLLTWSDHLSCLNAVCITLSEWKQRFTDLLACMLTTFLVPNWRTRLPHTFKPFWPVPTGLPPFSRAASKACFDALNLVSPQRLRSAWPWGLERAREVLMKDKNRLRRENTKKVCTELVIITELSVVPGVVAYGSLNTLTASFFSRHLPQGQRTPGWGKYCNVSIKCIDQLSEAKKWVKSVLSWYLIGFYQYNSEFLRLSPDICECPSFDEILEYTWLSVETYLRCVIVFEVNLSILLELNLKRPH